MNLQASLHHIINVGDWFEIIINWMTSHWKPFFNGVSAIVSGVVNAISSVLLFPHPFIVIAIFTVLAWWLAKRGAGIFTLIGFFLIYIMGLWEATMDTLALVLAAVLLAIVVGVPTGILCSKNNTANKIIHPILDFMQTLPAFVYLIPAVLFFHLGPVPGVIATLVFSIPPAVRFTNLGIRQVPVSISESCRAFGATTWQSLWKAELPVALPTIMGGINQTIMLSLSMVVISGMIGAGGLGNEVLKGITQLRIDIGFEAGIAIVILAIFLDRVTQSLARRTGKEK
jgi:glycine betaine/proline transport system permease protein